MDTLAGFLVGRAVADEFEILNMAVSPAHRRCGIGGSIGEGSAWLVANGWRATGVFGSASFQ